jgi:ATP-dependent exoDNAse (exonuclease V) alpha subunit
MLAWALTVHKVQGQTLESGTLDLGLTFAEAQIYFALSRFTSLDQVSIARSVPWDKIRANRKALAFYDGGKEEEEEKEDSPQQSKKVKLEHGEV